MDITPVVAQVPGQLAQAIGEIRRQVGDAAFRWAIRELQRQGASIQQAIRGAVNHFSGGGRKRSRFEINLGPTPARVAKKLDFDPPAMNYADDVNYSRTKVSVGSKKRRSADAIFSAQIGALEETVYRWQACSKSLLGPGYLPLGYGAFHQFQTVQFLPMHMMSLTMHPNYPINGELGCHKRGMFRIAYLNAENQGVAPGRMGFQWLKNQSFTGAPSGLAEWQDESGNDNAMDGNQTFHKWTDIRLNLYGSNLVPLEYRIMLLTGLPEEMQPIESGAIGDYSSAAAVEASFPIEINDPINQFILDHTRNVIGNPLTGSGTDEDYKGKFRVVSDKTYKIPCLSYGNAASNSTTSAVNSTNVKNVNMFIRHDRFRQYDWRQRTTNRALNTNIEDTGWNINKLSNLIGQAEYCDVDREERLFFVITCNSAALQIGPHYDVTNPVGGPQPDLIDPLAPANDIHGSYDIVVRNCFRNSTGANPIP